jgi:DNA-binding NtrC family response regulator
LNTGAAAARPAAAAEAGPFDLEALERRHVQEVLAKMRGNKVQAAKALGVSRRALYRLIDKYGLGPAKEPAAGPDAGEPASPAVEAG